MYAVFADSLATIPLRVVATEAEAIAECEAQQQAHPDVEYRPFKPVIVGSIIDSTDHIIVEHVTVDNPVTPLS